MWYSAHQEPGPSASISCLNASTSSSDQAFGDGLLGSRVPIRRRRFGAEPSSLSEDVLAAFF